MRPICGSANVPSPSPTLLLLKTSLFFLEISKGFTNAQEDLDRTAGFGVGICCEYLRLPIDGRRELLFVRRPRRPQPLKRNRFASASVVSAPAAEASCVTGKTPKAREAEAARVRGLPPDPFLFSGAASWLPFLSASGAAFRGERRVFLLPAHSSRAVLPGPWPDCITRRCPSDRTR